MKKIILLSGMVVLLHTVMFAQAQHPPKCGMQQYHEAMIAQDPSWKQKFEDQRNSLQVIANNYIQMQKSGALERTTTTISAIPVIFHIVVDSAQFNGMGGTAGIIKRCDSQIAVLNRDFNAQNADSTSIPTAWKPLYGNSGIKFGLARIDPSGNCSPGYEVKIISACGFTDDFDNYKSAKQTATGLASWDVSKYYNVWCVNFVNSTSSCSSNGLLGITQPKSGGTTSSYQGVVILYNSLGKTAPGVGSVPAPYNLGRTLTHETGHFFEIWHTWGDDGGTCPWSGGYDDGLTDTPPESDAVYGTPTYTVAGGTITDGCKMNGTVNTQPAGIACLSYMDYTDDNAMHLFTTMQAAAMASMVLVSPTGAGSMTGQGGLVGENYNLTQNPALLVACPTGVTMPNPVEIKSSLSVYPNPTSGEINVSINSAVETLNEIVVINMIGQQVAMIKGQGGKDYYSIDLSGMSKGIYFVKCNFASGSVTRKILLQ